MVSRTPAGVAYQAPEIGLLFKAKHARPKDDADLAVVVPSLSKGQRKWLADALARIHPGHRWLDCLGGRAAPAAPARTA